MKLRTHFPHPRGARHAFRYVFALCGILCCAVASRAQTLTLSGTNHMELGDYVTLYPSTLGGSWTSSNAGVATVDRGVVKSIATGSATISYTSTVGSVTSLATMSVTVEPVTEVCRPWEGLGGNGGWHSAYTNYWGTKYIAYPETGTGQMTVKTYSGTGTTWNIVGTAGFTTAGADYIDIACDRSGTPYVAFADVSNLKKITVMKYNGTSWITVGAAGFSSSNAAFCQLAIDSTGTPYVAYLEYTPGSGAFFRETSSSQSLAVKKFDGTSWVSVGTLPGGIEAMYEANNDHNRISFALDNAGTPYLAYVQASFLVKVIRYNGTSWVDLGIPSPSWYSNYPCLTISPNNNIYVSFLSDGAVTAACAYKYTGSGWNNFGQFSPSALIGPNSIAADANENVYLNFSSYDEGGASKVMKYNGSSWSAFGLASSDGTRLSVDGDGTLYEKGYATGLMRIGRKNTAMADIDGSSVVCVGTYNNYYHETGNGCWESSNPSVLEKPYNFYNTMRAISVGTATITFSNGTCVQTKPVTVNAAPTIGPSTDVRICVGSTATLTGTPSGGTWSNYGSSSASVSSAGEVTGLTGGVATIDYSYAGCPATKGVTVDISATTLDGPATVEKTRTIFLRSNAREGTWISSNTNATVTTFPGYPQMGVVYGANAGTATISYSVSNTCGTSLSTQVVTVQPFSCTAWNYLGTAGFSSAATPYVSSAVSPSGVLYVGYSDGSTGPARMKKYTSGAWSPVGSGAAISAGRAYDTKIAINGSGIPYIVFQDAGNSDQITVRKFEDTAWVTVGTLGFSAGLAKYASIAINNSGTPYVVYKDMANSKKATVMKFDGTSWVTVGAVGFSAGIAEKPVIAIDGSGTPYVAYRDSSNSNKATVMKYNGTSWVNVGGAGLTTGTADNISLVIDASGSPFICATDYGASNLTVRKFDGTNWVMLGNTGYTGLSNSVGFTVTPDGTPYIAFPDPNTGAFNGTGMLTVSKYDGSGWPSVGVRMFTPSSVSVVSLVSDASGTLYTAFRDNSAANFVSAMKFAAGMPAITGVGGVCPGATITLANKSTAGTWSSSNTAMATVGSTGVVTGVGTGMATISYAIGGCVATKDVVAGAYPGVINGPSVVRQGATAPLLPTVAGGVWSVSNANATMSFTGIITGVSMGAVTVTYTVYSTCGTSSVTKDMTVTLPSITGIMSVVGSGTTTLSNTIPGGTWSTGCGDIATVSSDGTVTGVSNGMATITYTAAGDYVTAVVTVNTETTAITGARAFCLGANTDLGHPISGGTWSSSNDSVATVDSNGIVSSVAAGTATISYDYGSGCTSTATVTINAVPSAGTISGASAVYVGSSIALTASATGGTWSAGNSHATVSSVGVVTGVSAGSVVISYSVGSSCGTVAATKTVFVAEDTTAPSVGAITGTLSLCAGTTTALGNATAGGSWSSDDASVATISTGGVVTGVGAGTSTISYTTTGGTATAIVTVSAVPTITGGLALCPGSTTSLSTTATGGSWTGGIASIATVGATGVVTGISAGTANITYSLGTGCRASVTVTVGSAPSSITGTLKACPGTSTTLGSATTGGSWSTSDATIATADASGGIITGVAPGTVTVTYTTGAGCYRTANYTVNATPAAIAGTMLICAGTITTLTNATPGLSWTSGNTAVATINPSGVVTGVSNGLATITYTAASTNCITTAEVTVNGVPATIGGPATGCTGFPITLTNSVSGGVWTSGNIATATVGSATGVVTGVASGIVTVTYTTGAGCYKTKQISINNSPTVSGYPTACVGLTTTLSGGGSGTWSSSTPSVATIVTSGGYVSGVSAGTSTMTFTSSGTGCPTTIVVTVIPMPSAITGPTQACTGAVLALTNSTPGGVWTSANTANATVGAATGITNIVGTGGSVTISYSFGNNCRVTKAIALKPLPAIINGSPTVCTPVTTTLTTVTSGGTWTSSNTSVATIGTAISASYGLVTGVSAGTTEITYTITSTGCARSTIVTVSAGLSPGTITSSGGFTLHTISPLTSVTLSSTGAVGGTWSSSNPAVATVNSSTGVVTAVSAGTTTITYAVTASCTNIATKVITVTAGRPAISENTTISNIQLYPNPTTGAFTLVSEEGGMLNVFSIDGKEITRYEVKAGINPLTLPNGIASGIYMCRFTGEGGNTMMVRLVYER